LEYYGIEAEDNPFFDLSIYFLPVAQYIGAALNTPRGELLGKALDGLEVRVCSGLSIFPVALMGGESRAPNLLAILPPYGHLMSVTFRDALETNKFRHTKIHQGHQCDHSLQ
jgi:hypothetical protein